VAKTAYRRHQQQRHMLRRLRYPAWAWAERVTDPDVRAAICSRAGRQSVPCSCPLCSVDSRTLRYKAQRTTQEVTAYA
jgi:hypothetical protein